ALVKRSRSREITPVRFKTSLSRSTTKDSMPKISSDDALALARLFKESGHELGQYQLDHWDELSKAQRNALTEKEHELLDNSQNLITEAVGVLLDDTKASLAQIKKATNQANDAIQTVKKIKKVLTIASALVTLGASIYAGNPGGTADAI